MANKFEAELSQSMKHLGWFVAKLAVPTGGNIRFLHNPPFDFIAFDSGLAFGMEAKSTREHSSLPLARLEDHQREGLTFFASKGGLAFVLVNFRQKKARGKIHSDNVAYAITIADWHAITAELATKHKRKSIPQAWFGVEPRIKVIPRVRVNNKLIWDLRVLQDSK